MPSGAGPSSSEDLSRIRAFFDGAMAGLEAVEAKRLFGHDGYFVNGNIFAMVWKDGRLGLRLTEASSHAALMAMDGAEPCRMGSRTMRHWVLLPQDLRHRPADLKSWTTKAWEQARQRPAKESVTRRKAQKRIRPAVFRKL